MASELPPVRERRNGPTFPIRAGALHMTQSPSSPRSGDVYAEVTSKIIRAMEAGAGEFVMPWHREGPALGVPTNATTQARYKGINVLSLWVAAASSGFNSGHWASYRQWQAAGAQVRGGEHGTTIIFYRVRTAEDEDGHEDDANRRRPIVRSSRVFNADQVDGWEIPTQPQTRGADRLASIDAFVRATQANVHTGGNVACYRPKNDRIDIPPPERFVGSPTSSPTESYYATLLHELVHWSGAPQRLSRDLSGRFGDAAYAAEELVAELGAAFLCAALRLSNEPRPDHAAYLASWLRLLRNDKTAIARAASLAQIASTYLEGLQPT